jgi:addiction module HigA family antidote
MIKSFSSNDTERLFYRKSSSDVPADIRKVALRKLLILDAAEKLEDLRVPPGNRLEKLSRDRRGQHSIRINDQWRICFRWSGSDALDVEIVDYHWEDETMRDKKIPPIHPGEILMEEFLLPLGISQYKLAKEISVPARRINEIVHGKRSISADTALRLSRYFKLSERFWLNLQTRFDLETEKDRLNGRINVEVKIFEMSHAWPVHEPAGTIWVERTIAVGAYRRLQPWVHETRWYLQLKFSCGSPNWTIYPMVIDLAGHCRAIPWESWWYALQGFLWFLDAVELAVMFCLMGCDTSRGSRRAEEAHNPFV